MFKLAIVEDEDNIRHSLECFIPWEKIGFQVVGAFSDGTDALAYLREHPCDVVLTDILMSRMSGLEMIQQLHEIHPAIKVVILSGHSDFGYAQQAIRYQVSHYLVKPVDEDELIGVFQGLKEQLDSEVEDNLLVEIENRELKQMLQRNFFRDLLLGNISSEQELDEYLKLLGIEETRKLAGVVAFEIEAEGSEIDSLDAAAENILKTHLHPADRNVQSFCFEDRSNHWKAIFLGTDSGALRNCGSESVQKTVDELNKSVPGTYSGHLTHNVLHLTDLLTTIKGKSQTELQPDSTDYKLLILELDQGCEKTVLHLLNEEISRLGDMTPADMVSRIKDTYTAVEENYRKRKIDLLETTGGRFHSNHLFYTADREELIRCVTEDFRTLCRDLRNRDNRSEHNVIARIVQYLDQHLHEEIDHEAIAAKYRLHPGYLSRLFKQEMGETLSEYLLRIRIERAAQLLKEERYKIGDIAGMVGYSTSSYFSVMFKKYAGCSPREYCQRVSL